MSYSEFTNLTKLKSSFNLTFDEDRSLFTQIEEIQPSQYLSTTLNEYLPLANAINTEKARSELIIAPILLEIRRIFDSKVGFFSGIEFNIEPSSGLNGYCD